MQGSANRRPSLIMFVIDMKFSVLALVAVWTVFAVVWAIGWVTAKRTVRRNWFGGAWWRIAAAAAVVVFARYRPVHGQGVVFGVVQNDAVNVVGVVIAALGVALAVWARVHLGRNWGMPLSVKANPELVTTGPYARIRHPIYAGILLALLGSSFVFWQWGAVFAVALAYFTYASRGEEALLQREFPDAYPAYKARTWRLIPRVW